MTKRFIIVAMVIAIASLLAAIASAPLIVVLAIIGSGLVGFAMSLSSNPNAQINSFGVIVIMAAVTLLGGLVQVLMMLPPVLWGIFLGLVIGTPIGFSFGRE